MPERQTNYCSKRNFHVPFNHKLIIFISFLNNFNELVELIYTLVTKCFRSSLLNTSKKMFHFFMCKRSLCSIFIELSLLKEWIQFWATWKLAREFTVPICPNETYRFVKVIKICRNISLWSLCIKCILGPEMKCNLTRVKARKSIEKRTQIRSFWWPDQM